MAGAEVQRRNLASLRRELAALGHPDRALKALRFFKSGPGQYGEGDRFRGIPVPTLRALAREYRSLPPETLSPLLASPFHEDRHCALIHWTDAATVAFKACAKQDTPSRGPMAHPLTEASAKRAAQARTTLQNLHTLYVDGFSGVNNWDLVDVSAEALLGAPWSLLGRDAARKSLLAWAESPELWRRRAAMIATRHSIRRGEFTETFRLARLLKRDGEDLIHKAVGWMLREAGEKDRAALVGFLAKEASGLPRTALRVALEKFPDAQRQRFLRMA